MVSRVCSPKPRSKSGGFLYESGVRAPRVFKSFTIPPFDFRNPCKFHHFVVADARAFSVPHRADPASGPMWVLGVECFVHAIEHVAATAPAMAGDFSDEIVSERNVRHFRARKCG
jgi:hypothetical protein